MMGDLTIAEASDVEVVPSLDQLAEEINRGHAECEAMAGNLVEKWISVGRSVLAAREGVERGSWAAWCVEHLSMGASMASVYARVASYPDDVRRHVAGHGHALGIHQVSRSAIGGLPAVVTSNHDERLVEEAKAMVAAGTSQRETARLLGISPNSIRYWLDPSKRDRHRRQSLDAQRRKREREREARLAAQALEQKRRADAARKIGGNGGHCYAEIRKALSRAQGALDDGGDKAAWAEVQRHLRRAEEATLDALKIERSGS